MTHGPRFPFPLAAYTNFLSSACTPFHSSSSVYPRDLYHCVLISMSKNHPIPMHMDTCHGEVVLVARTPDESHGKFPHLNVLLSDFQKAARPAENINLARALEVASTSLQPFTARLMAAEVVCLWCMSRTCLRTRKATVVRHLCSRSRDQPVARVSVCMPKQLAGIVNISIVFGSLSHVLLNFLSYPRNTRSASKLSPLCVPVTMRADQILNLYPISPSDAHVPLLSSSPLPHSTNQERERITSTLSLTSYPRHVRQPRPLKVPPSWEHPTFLKSLVSTREGRMSAKFDDERPKQYRGAFTAIRALPSIGSI